MFLFSETVAAGMRAVAAEEMAEARLRFMARPSWADFLMAEVERRTAMYSEAWAARPEAPPLNMTARGAALLSVGEDVARGWLG